MFFLSLSPGARIAGIHYHARFLNNFNLERHLFVQLEVEKLIILADNPSKALNVLLKLCRAIFFLQLLKIKVLKVDYFTLLYYLICHTTTHFYITLLLQKISNVLAGAAINKGKL